MLKKVLGHELQLSRSLTAELEGEDSRAEGVPMGRENLGPSDP